MFAKKPSSHRLLILLLIFWHLVIFLLSSIPELHSGLPGFWDFILRKYAHALEFGVLSTLWVAVLQCPKWVRPRVGPLSYTLAGILTFLWAVLDEFHQTVVPGRFGHPLDVLVDSSGILLALFLCYRGRDFSKRGSTPPEGPTPGRTPH